ncbi:uncharacterized protein [Spinacia oleracea]|uniref:Retrotransposon gag domain-containing protein n=1 Tax=Spinacia oleracea TaxID=3562 RepID=A0ABM3QYC7_SPIOL|nr:uncharacterized protein LOC130463289 [Spinacia oleracea]
MHLSRIQQGKDESLRSYVKCFNLEADQIPDLQNGASFDNLIRGLKKGSFKIDLVKKRTMFDLERLFPIKSPVESRDPKLYCQFHDDIGHDTKYHRTLKRALDGLAAKGHLKSYLQKSTHGTRKKLYKKNKSPTSAGGDNQTDGGHMTQRQLKESIIPSFVLEEALFT